jgi:hypothetical protein
MFTKEEEPLIRGSREEIDEFVDCDRCLVVDWRGSEEEVLDDAQAFLPMDSLTYEQIETDPGSVDLLIRFMGREDALSLRAQPQNNFRVLQRLSALVQPDFDMKLFRITENSDTQGFLIRPKEWWDAYRSSHPKQYAEVFTDMNALTKLWNLEEQSEVTPTEAKPWWKLWG